MAKSAQILPGTLDMLILKAVSLAPLHGYGVLLRIGQISNNALEIPQGSLYPALYRLEHQGLIDAEWGESNVLDVAHPFAASVGPLSHLLSLPRAQLPGSMVSLRVAAPNYGAVLRMAVSPAAPENGVLELAGGQSGHFLSPHFRDLQQDWVAGTPTPFLAGEPTAQFLLTP